MKLLLAIGFFITAILYASVGFGGGSTYTALLAVSGTPFILIPIISLSCNISVVAGSTVRYQRARHIKWIRLFPILIVSIPAAWAGGRMNVSEPVFLGLLWVALLVAGIRLIISSSPADPDGNPLNPTWASALGGMIGFYSGIVGIGGGIFLAPILYALRWGRAHEIAAATSVFILFNSSSGLMGQMSKIQSQALLNDALSYWPLIASVLIGGWIGNTISLKYLSPKSVRRFTGLLILIVAIRLLVQWLQIML